MKRTIFILEMSDVAINPGRVRLQVDWIGKDGSKSGTFIGTIEMAVAKEVELATFKPMIEALLDTYDEVHGITEKYENEYAVM